MSHCKRIRLSEDTMRRRVLGSSKENSSSIYFAWVEHRVNSMGGAVSFPDIGPPGGGV